MTTHPAEAAREYAASACYQDENRPIAEAAFLAGWKAALEHKSAGSAPCGTRRRPHRWVCIHHSMTSHRAQCQNCGVEEVDMFCAGPAREEKI